MKIRNQINYDRKTDSKPEANTLPSLTVPNQSMSAREILDRTIRGLPIQGAKVPIYEPEQILPDIRKMDLADQQELREQAAADLKELKEKFKRQNAPKLKDPPKPKEESKDPEPAPPVPPQYP